MAKEKAKDVEKGKVKDQPKDDKEKQKKEQPKVERTIKALVRVVNTDLDGDKPLIRALGGIVGVGAAMSKAICTVSGLNPDAKLGSLDQTQIEKLEQVINDPIKFGVPVFMANRRFDLGTGKDMHLTGQDFDASMKFDVKREIDMKSYRGWRHMMGQPVRGQETRSHFRQKGRVVGVMRKTIQLQAKPAAAPGAPTAPVAQSEAKKEVKK